MNDGIRVPYSLFKHVGYSVGEASGKWYWDNSSNGMPHGIDGSCLSGLETQLTKWSYYNGGQGSATQNNFAICGTRDSPEVDGNLFYVSTGGRGTETTAFAVAVQLDPALPLNAAQCTTYNSDGTIAYGRENRAIVSIAGASEDTGQNVIPNTKMTIGTSLSGILSPKTLGGGKFEACTRTLKYFFGTPAQIRFQVTGQ